ncbi:MAG: MATE family efflux transporter [Lachnospiraceae bacterium]|nr:MATE family efflux transporter [Lachnospiraceae bacterium]
MSKRSNVVNMTEGNPAKLILAFALPMLLGNLFQQMYNMVDCIIVGKCVGDDALAAVGATGSVNFFFFSISNGIGTGVGIVAAQFFGAGEHSRVRRAVSNSIYVVGAVGIVMSLLGFFAASPLLHLLNTPEECIDMSITYMRITCGGSLAVVGYNTVSSLLRALGDSKTPLMFLIVSCVLNIGLDLTFVRTLHMGVAGVAFATVISQLFSTFCCVAFARMRNPYFRIEKDERKPSPEIIKKSFSLGVPIAFMMSTISVSCIALQWVVNGFGPVVGAANTSITKIEQIIQQPYGSLGAALSSYAGQNLGAGKTDRIRKGFFVGVRFVAVFSAIMFLIPKLFGRQIIGIFINDPEAISIGARGLMISSSFYFFLGMIYVCRGTLNGIGDSRYAMLNGFTELGCRCCLPKPITSIPSIGKWGIWMTTGLTWTITGVMSLFRFRSKMRSITGIMKPKELFLDEPAADAQQA